MRTMVDIPSGKCEACHSFSPMYILDDVLGMVKYKVCGNCLVGLVTHSLIPEQFRNLIASGHHENEFLLHEDFYDEEGNALQPYM